MEVVSSNTRPALQDALLKICTLSRQVTYSSPRSFFSAASAPWAFLWTSSCHFDFILSVTSSLDSSTDYLDTLLLLLDLGIPSTKHSVHVKRI